MKLIVKETGKYTLGLLFLAAMILLASGQAFATITYGFIPITNNRWEEGDEHEGEVAQLAENFSLEVEVLQAGDPEDDQISLKILSTLTNDVGGAGFSITDIYFYDFDMLDVSRGVEIASYGKVAFSPEGVAPGYLPGLKTDVALAYSADSDSPVPKNGVNVDEWISFKFFLGGNLDDAVTALNIGQMFVGIHVQGFEPADGDYSESFVSSISSTTPSSPPSATPVPAAVWLLGSGLLILVGLRRKSRG